ncbi:hypothetical protein M413DRAFT_30506 [Hebeloma cylindrosporum]|uniref:Uncharacterized protein n=1 Tax=Hebeloma cylindrosporum TaxID=76867 RepID=A0A0C3C0L8_HEBCY|nr:hypothetical protein M413DRAFT_30506 [Hebeloma cylindrosporum h7]
MLIISCYQLPIVSVFYSHNLKDFALDLTRRPEFTNPRTPSFAPFGLLKDRSTSHANYSLPEKQCNTLFPNTIAADCSFDILVDGTTEQHVLPQTHCVQAALWLCIPPILCYGHPPVLSVNRGKFFLGSVPLPSPSDPPRR